MAYLQQGHLVTSRNPKAEPKQLVYMLNYVHVSDSQHFVHVLNLLSALRDRGWSIALLSEKGGRGVRYLSEWSRWVRIPRFVRELLKLRLKGYRLVFVRISKMPAIAFTERMAAGLPIVTTDAGFYRDVVTNGVEGFVINVDGDDQLVDRLSALFSDEALRSRMGAAARVRAKTEFDAAIVFERHRLLIRKAAAA